MTNSPSPLLLLFVSLASLFPPAASSRAEDSTVEIDVSPATALSIGGKTTLDRSKYFSIHGSPDRLPAELLTQFVERTDAHLGRSVDLLRPVLIGAKEDPGRPGFRNKDDLIRRTDALIEKQGIGTNPFWKEVGIAMHPEDLFDTNKERAWYLAESDEGRIEAIQTMLSRFADAGNPVPFFEPMNEPRIVFKEKKIDVSWPRIIEFHRNIIPRLKTAFPEMKVGGPAAWRIRFNSKGFDHWNEDFRLFIDQAGDIVDFLSLHPYAAVEKKDRIRECVAGPRIEASLDLINNRMLERWGKTVPLYISEYGLGQLEDPKSVVYTYSPYRDWAIMKEINDQMLTYLNRPDEILRAIPFIVPHSTWWRRDKRSSPEAPYFPWVLFHVDDDDWKPTHLVDFYAFWKPVRGNYVWTRSSDPNVQVAAFRDGDTTFLCVNNLVAEERPLSLKLQRSPGGGNLEAASITKSSLTTDGSKPIFENDVPVENSGKLILRPDEIAIFKIVTPGVPAPVATVKRTTHYGDRTVLPITNAPLQLKIENVPTKNVKAAVLRLSYSGNPAPPKPAILFNGQKLEVPGEEFGRKGPQDPAGDFWVVKWISVPPDLLAASNVVEVQFEKAGGHVSSVALITEQEE